MIVVEAPFRSEPWEAFLQVRREVLRWPLGLEYSDDDLAAEAADVCLVAVEASPSPREREVDPRSGDGGRITALPPSPTMSGLPPLGGEDSPSIGGLLLRPADAELKMRQVAVRADLQGRGVGRSLVEASEAYALSHGFERIVLHARTSAVPFYLALGYETEGDEFEEVGIPHLFMFKNLTR